ncbi:MAG: peptidoglycan-binding protein [Sandaracinaceae bacterium]
MANLADGEDGDDADDDRDPIPDPVTIQLRQLQNALIRAGYDVGRTGADGRWGSNTQGAFSRFLQREDRGGTGRIQINQSVSPQMVLMEQSVWNALVNAPAGSGGERQSRPTTRPSTPTTTTSTPSTGGSTSSPASEVDLGEEEAAWYESPWLLGGIALTAAAGIAYVATRPTEPDEEPLQDEELLPAF